MAKQGSKRSKPAARQGTRQAGGKARPGSTRGRETPESAPREVSGAEDVQRHQYASNDTPMEVPTERVRQVLTEGVRHEEAGEQKYRERLRRHTATSPQLSGDDVDAAWDRADVGEETVGGSHATPDQDVVEEIGEAVGVTYEDDEPLAMEDKVAQRDTERWELDPASSDDYQERVGQRETEEETEDETEEED